MLAFAANRMGYRVQVYSPAETSYADLGRVREFASGVDVVTVAEGDVPVITLRAAAGSCDVYPSPEVFEAVENGIGTKRGHAAEVLAEFSVIGARGGNGDCALYAPIAIDRAEDVIEFARSPAPIHARIAKQAVSLTRDTLEELDLTGIACVEFTLTQEHSLVVNEVTPHPHISGYLTEDACVTSQFEQQLRAVCGLPLGSAELLRPAAMAARDDDEPDWAAAYAFPEVKVHAGYLTATAVSATRAKEIVRAARASLRRHVVP